MTIDKKIILEITHSFPSEIIREILLRATVKSLLRCKSVCKEWYYLISDRQFIKSHYTLSSTNDISYQHHRLIYSTNTFEKINNLKVCPLSNLMLDKSANALMLQNPLQQTRPQAFRIVGSCNGLLCYFSEDLYYYYLFIYNPSTRICNGLPFRLRHSLRLSYSFGYDESTDDYKVVELAEIYIRDFPITHPYINKVQIYSLKTGKWKILGDFSSRYPLKTSGIFSNGALHWVAYGVSHKIVSLDLAKETYGEVLLFEYDEDATKLITLGVLGECLSGLCYHYKSHSDLWVMKVYGVKDSWTKLGSFPYLTLPWFCMYPVPRFISYDGKVLIECAPDLVIYNSKDSSSPQIECISNKDEIFEACVVVESLVSPFPPLALADNNQN